MGDCERVGSNTTFDYKLAYSGIPHVKLNLYIDKLFNRPAPIQWRGLESGSPAVVHDWRCRELHVLSSIPRKRQAGTFGCRFFHQIRHICQHLHDEIAKIS
jgi:hypothetical protein